MFCWLCYYSCPIFFSPLFPSALHPTLPPAFPCLVDIRGRTYKFLGFSISYTILNLPLSIFYLPFMLLICCTFSPILLLTLPADVPPCDLHFCDSVPVLVVCLVCFWSFIFRFSCWLLWVYCHFTVHSFDHLLFLKYVPLTFHKIRAWWWLTPLTWPYLRSTLSALPF